MDTLSFLSHWWLEKSFCPSEFIHKASYRLHRAVFICSVSIMKNDVTWLVLLSSDISLHCSIFMTTLWETSDAFVWCHACVISGREREVEVERCSESQTLSVWSLLSFLIQNFEIKTNNWKWRCVCSQVTISSYSFNLFLLRGLIFNTD